MKSIEFVESLRESLITSNLNSYQELFLTTDLKKVKDPYWIDALSLFSVLSENQKKTLFAIIRQIEVDTVSNFLGILDGSSYLDENKTEFTLTANSNNKKINGSLQDIFLSLEEQAG